MKYHLYLGACYNFKVQENRENPSPIFNFGDTVTYFQKDDIRSPLVEKHGAGIVGHSMALGKDDTVVVGSPNFSLGEPTRTCRSPKDAPMDCRYAGIGNILRFGKLPGKSLNAFVNPPKEHRKIKFRKDLKKELKDNNQGTPSLYLGSTVIRGKFTNSLFVSI